MEDGSSRQQNLLVLVSRPSVSFSVPVQEIKLDEYYHHHAAPSEVFKRYFGPEYGVELPLGDRYGYRPVELEREG